MCHRNFYATMSERGVEIVDGIGRIAALLDLEDEGYVAAVDAQRAALQDPALTPSAQIVAEMRSRGQSFSEFTLDVSRTHADYFRELELPEEKEALFVRAAARSRQRTEELERAEEPSFEAYLASYFENI